MILKSFTLWFTGLPNAGKTTLSKNIYQILINKGIDKVELLDGEKMRAYLSNDGTVPGCV